jgi:hypothetical protein
MHHCERPNFRLTRHARERMAHRNLTPEQLKAIEDYGTKVYDGILMLHNDIARAIQPLEDQIREHKQVITANQRKRGLRPSCGGDIRAHQEKIADIRAQIEAIRKTEDFLICIGEEEVVITVQRVTSNKRRRALRGPARARPAPDRRRRSRPGHSTVAVYCQLAK